jgi:hypothetical protein
MTRITILLIVMAIVVLPSVSVAADVSLTIYFTNRGEPLEDPLNGRYYVIDPEQGEHYIAWGNAERPVRVPEGVYTVVIRYVNGEIEHEEVFEEVELTKSIEHEIDFDIPIARLTLWVTTGGFPIARHAGRYSLHRAGQRGKPLVSKRPGETVTIRPGVYDIEVAYRGPDGLESKWLENYNLESVQQESIDIGASTSQVRMTLLDRGRPLAREAGVWRVYRRGMRDHPIAEARTGEVLVLDTGVYDIGLFYLAGTERGERWLSDVEFSGNVDRQIDVAAESDRVTVDIRNRGKTVTDAWFTVYPAGSRQTELYSGRSGESVEINPGLYDIGCFLRRGGVRAESWLENQSLEGPVNLEVELEYREASLRVSPRRGRKRDRDLTSNLLVVVDSSADMMTPLDGKTRLEQTQSALVQALDGLTGTDPNVGLRVFGIAPRAQHDCSDSTLLVPVSGFDRGDLSRSLRFLRPSGYSPIAFSLEQAATDLPSGGSSSVLLITGSTESCEADPCAAAAQLMRDGRVSRIYVLALGADRTAQRGLDCIGEYRAVRSEMEFQSALRDVVREVRRREGGSVVLFKPGKDEIVASGALEGRLRVSEGTYDVLIRAGGDTFTWPSVTIRGNMEAKAGDKPPRSR